MSGELGRSYQDGEVVFHEGEKGDVMFVVQSGTVKITKKSATGPMTIAMLGPGEIFGEMALFDKLPRSASASAAGETRILHVDKQKLFSTISHDPTLVFKILETMSGRIRRLDEVLTNLVDAKTGLSRKLHFNTEDTCRLILEEARESVRAENGSIMLYDDSGANLMIQAAFGDEAEAKVLIAPGEGIAGDVLRTGRAELVNSVAKDPRYKSGGLSIRSLLCVPLKCSGQTIGVMNMSNASERAFTLEQLKFLHALSIYASMAIQNARNFSNLRSAADRVLAHVSMLEM